MKIIYISIPIMGCDNWKEDVQSVKSVINRAIESAGVKDKIKVVTPLDVYKGNPSTSYGRYLGEDIAFIADKVDIVYMSNIQWYKSTGCTVEHTLACRMNKTICYTLADVFDEINKLRKK